MYLYVIFLALILIGAALVFILKAPESIKRTDISEISSDQTGLLGINKLHDDDEDSLESALDPNGHIIFARQHNGNDINRTEVENVTSETLSKHSWASEFLATLGLFGSKSMLMLLTIIFYTGFNQPYQ